MEVGQNGGAAGEAVVEGAVKDGEEDMIARMASEVCVARTIGACINHIINRSYMYPKSLTILVRLATHLASTSMSACLQVGTKPVKSNDVKEKAPFRTFKN